MPTYRITGPDGKTYQIQGPSGATTEQVKAEVIRQNPHLAQSKPQVGAQPEEITTGRMVGQAFKNFPRSAYELGKSTVEALTSPVETAKSMYSLGSSVLGKLGVTDANPEMANRVGQFYKDRYGSTDAAMQTFAKDPAGFLADVSTVLFGAGAALRAAPATARIGERVTKAAAVVDPLTAATKGVKAAGGATAGVLGFTTGTGTRAVKEAAKAGYRGGEAGEAFVSQMRPTGASAVTDVVEAVKPAIASLKKDRSAAYRSGMANIAKDKTILNFDDIDKAVGDVRQTGIYKGQVIDESAAEAWQKINDKISNWKSLDPAEFHTPEGLDALKKSLKDVKESYPFGSPARLAADKAYNAVRAEVTKQAPEYSRVMKDYETASDLLEEMEKTLSLNPKASVDTQVRKLQSILRNNANTNYGRRVELGEILAQQGAPNLFPALAGQAMSSWSPRGLSGALSGAGALYNVVPNIMSGLTPTGVLQMASTSPRLVGETAYAMGRAAGTPQRLASLLAKHGAELINKSPELAMSVDRASRLLSQGKKVDPQLARLLAYQLGQFERATEQQEQQ